MLMHGERSVLALRRGGQEVPGCDGTSCRLRHRSSCCWCSLCGSDREPQDWAITRRHRPSPYASGPATAVLDLIQVFYNPQRPPLHRGLLATSRLRTPARISSTRRPTIMIPEWGNSETRPRRSDRRLAGGTNIRTAERIHGWHNLTRLFHYCVPTDASVGRSSTDVRGGGLIQTSSGHGLWRVSLVC
jgi:hypothetical protein